MRFNAHENMTPAELGEAANRTYQAKHYAAGRVKGFPGLSLVQFHAVRRFIELRYLELMHAGDSNPRVTDAEINHVIQQHQQDGGV